MGGSAVKGVKWEAWRSQEPGSPGRGLGTATVKGGGGGHAPGAEGGKAEPPGVRDRRQSGTNTEKMSLVYC